MNNKNTDSPFSVVLVDDHLLFRREMKKIIEEVPGAQVIGEAGDGSELFGLLEKHSPDLIILDVSIPGLKAMEGTRMIKQKYPQVKVLIMIMEEEKEYLDRAIAAGAEGVLLKQDTASEFFRAIGRIRRGKHYLPRKLNGGKSGIGTWHSRSDLWSMLAPTSR